MISVLIFGAVIGGIWALVASGFSLIFGVMRILNFGHGAIFVASAYMAIFVSKICYPLSLPSALLVGVLFGLMFYTITKPVRENEVAVIIVTLATALLIQQILLSIFGDRGLTMQPLLRGIVNLFGVRFTVMRIFSIVIALTVLIALEVMMRTRFGKKIEAVSEDFESAMLVGINVERIYIFVMVLSSILASLAGYFYVQIFSVNPELSLRALIYAFAIVILGGLGSVRGSILASFIIGYIVALTITLLGSRWSEFVMLLTIILTLIVKPSGIFGVEE